MRLFVPTVNCGFQAGDADVFNIFINDSLLIDLPNCGAIIYLVQRRWCVNE